VLKQIRRISTSPTPLTKLVSPVLELLQPLLTDTRSDIDETVFEVGEGDRTDLIHGHVEQGFTKTTEWSHRGVFG